MYKDESLSLYRRSFRDIVKGYTKKSYQDEVFFIKHLTTHDQVDLEDIEIDFYNKAKKKGLSTEEERIASLKEDGLWSDEDEKFIDSQTSFIENLTRTKAQLILKSQIDQHQKLIDTEVQKLNKKLSDKQELIGSTCEAYAKQRVNDYYIGRSFFKDEEFTEPLYEENDFYELSYSEVGELVKIHNDQFTQFSEDNIQKIILQDFFFPYMPFCEDTVQFFGKSVCELTHNQLKLILFTKVFKNIFDNNENIPENIRKDPEALLDFASSSKKGKEHLEKHEEKGGASTLVGATSKDYEYMGVNARGGKSLHQAAKEKGGSLNMQDLMDLSGS